MVRSPAIAVSGRRLLLAAASIAVLAGFPAGAGAVELRPVNLIPPAITGPPVVGQPLACSQGVWAGPPSAYACQWTRDGADLPGATLASYTVISSDAGKALRCGVTASNSAGSAQATSAPVIALSTPIDPPRAPRLAGLRRRRNAAS